MRGITKAFNGYEMLRKLLYALIAVLLIASGFYANMVFAGDIRLTFVGEDELDVYDVVAPAKRVDVLYRWGDNRVVIEYSGVKLIPISQGDSMMPMVAEGHQALITADFEVSDIQVGDFVVVENLTGRYFHQVVGIRDGDKGLVFTTRGINNSEDDLFPVFEQDIVGVAIAVVW